MAAKREIETMNSALRDRVVKAARRHASGPDADDRAQEVMLRLLGEVVRPGAPILEVRALAKLKDVEVDAFRKDSRQRGLLEKAAQAAATDSVVPSSQDAYRIIEMSDQIREIVGDDGLAYALVKTFFKATEADVCRCLGWSSQKAAAARMRLGRNKGRITRLLTAKQEEG